jgi:predicted nucleotidyltransferase
VYYCPFRAKEVISAPSERISQVYVPRDCLRGLTKKRNRDALEEKTLDFVRLLSDRSGIPMEDFGVHGSVALGMHTSLSDIDIVVYGSRNFRTLESTIVELVDSGILTYVSGNRLDTARRFKGRFDGRIFMYNAIRKPEEITSKYGAFSYASMLPVRLRCIVKSDAEAMFRPAIYEVQDCEPQDPRQTLPQDRISTVVSMIGCYRNVARRGAPIEVSGILERVRNSQTDEVSYQVVVGSGISEEEHVWPI